ncbi:NAD-dependent epimerase/dehydratase family protein [Nodularia sp. NIES-3585]|uniref:NAD-dependent epimerase/dehydratase family protein n=1 Tax=Nodularia sp. NIES-3585 TaxID=1973477 RepID=UPI000B5CCD3E|nr:NAD-dependent epimerase/dehydratase family protein [Nodularia sp. NIES-3585]GAX35552.1 sugar epimerase [Nodularia sp. NIES-3585]
MAQAFVTGGSGFVGGHMIRLLQERGYEVKALARSPRAAQQVAALGAKVVEGDLLNESAMMRGMQGCEVVFHVAGYISDWGRYEAFYEANVIGTERSLSAAKAAGVSRFVQVGASAVVMNKQPIFDADESLPLQTPSFSPYIATKSIAEQRVIAANAPGFTTSVIRPSWIWGEGDHAIPNIVKAVRQNQFLWIDQGNYLYVTTHVANVCHGSILAAQHSPGGQAYFLADDGVVKFRDWVRTLVQIEGVNPRNRSIPYIFAWSIAGLLEFLWKIQKRRDVPPITQSMVRLIGRGFTFSDRKARNELGYIPIMTREQGLKELRHQESVNRII